MKPFTKETILPYLKKNVFKHLDFISKGKLQEFRKASGGLVSQVYRLVVDGRPFYIKQAIPGGQKYLKIAKIPKDLHLLFSDTRQLAEAKALKIFEKAVGCNIAPHIYYHDTRNMVMVISEVCTPKAQLFEDIIDKEINLTASKKLAEIAAKLANNTYNKIKPIRSATADKKIKFTKLKYQCFDVCDKLDSKFRNLVKKTQINFSKESMKYNKVLVHGDYHPRNIVIEGTKVGTFDLEEAHLGDPAFDIGILIGSYLLRAEYHRNIRQAAIKATLEMIKIFMDKVNISEDKNKLDERIRKHAAGLMLSRIDGVPSQWTFWFKKKSAKELVRKNASKIILAENKIPFSILIKKNYAI